MRGVLGTVVGSVSLLIASAPAWASPNVGLSERIQLSEPNEHGFSTGTIILEPGEFEPGEPAEPTHHSGSHILFVNPCWDGCTLTPGFTDSRTDRFQGLGSTVHLSPYPGNDASWQRLMTCMREIYAPFNIAVTDVNPGNTPHFEAIAAGYPREVGVPDQVLGFAPGGCYGSEGAIIENAISFSFAAHMRELYGDWPEFICEVVAQESAHAMGLPDHLLNECDPMTYLSGCEGEKSFQNTLSTCGEYNPKACQCGGSQINSYQELMDRFGVAAPTPPNVMITSPQDGEQVQRGFIVRMDASDDHGINRVELYIDGNYIDAATTMPYIINAPATLGDGVHTVEARAFDSLNSSASHMITVTQGNPCGGDDDCQDGEACVEGRCVPGPETPGGIGTPCEDGSQCASGSCGELDGERLCTETCDPEINACPDGFTCLGSSGGSGVCWPGADGGGGTGGCCSVGADDDRGPLAPIALGLLVALVLLRRRCR